MKRLGIAARTGAFVMPALMAVRFSPSPAAADVSVQRYCQARSKRLIVEFSNGSEGSYTCSGQYTVANQPAWAVDHGYWSGWYTWRAWSGGPTYTEYFCDGFIDVFPGDIRILNIYMSPTPAEWCW